MLGPLHW